MDRRETMQWMLAAAASAATWRTAGATPAAPVHGQGYGTDPALVRVYRSGELWPLTFTPAQRRLAATLCALIIPADERSPSAAQLDVHVFIDEWISAPYPDHVKDRATLLAGFAWLDAESARRHARPFADADPAGQAAICDDICWKARAAAPFTEAATFFALLRDLVAGGFYTTPQGTQDLRFVGNVPSATFDGPPAAVLKLAGVS